VWNASAVAALSHHYIKPHNKCRLFALVDKIVVYTAFTYGISLKHTHKPKQKKLNLAKKTKND